MLFQDNTNFAAEDGDQLVNELFKSFESPDDPTFLSSPENDDYGFITPPLPSQQEVDYPALPAPSQSSLPAPSSVPELYPRIPNKKQKGAAIDIEKWTPYRPATRQYYGLYDINQHEIGSMVEVCTKIDKVDKREHYSGADEAYILYRQNQFQLDIDMLGNLQNYSSNPPTPSATSAATTPQTPLYVDLGGVFAPVECLFYHIYAVKQHKSSPLGPMEDQESLVDLVQLGGPRNRKDFQLPGLCPIVLGRATYSRLQFRAATPNNARVHPDQPNPNQQYYRIVLSLVAKTANSLNFIFSKISPCLMVRGQNPGKFQGHTGGVATPKPLSPTEPKQEFPKQEYTSSPYAHSQPMTPSLPYPDPSLAHNSPPPKALPPLPPASSQNMLLNQNSTQNLNITLNQNYIPNQLNLNQNSPNQMNLNQNMYTIPNTPNPTQLPTISTSPPPTVPNMNFPNPPPSRGTKRPPSSQPLLTDRSEEGWTQDFATGNVYTAAKVGINTTNPQEALQVHGNILVTGEYLKPSDERIKTNITPITTSTQLDNIERMRLYEYDIKAASPGGQQVHERGVIAQEVQKIMPAAVRVLKNVTLADGTIMPELLVVSDRALMIENIGATQEVAARERETRSRVKELSEKLSRHMHEMGESTKRLVNSMGAMMHFMTTEKKPNYENTCFFLSIFGLGPAWTMYILGFFLPILWFFGLFYIASAVSVKKTAGAVHFTTFVLYVVYIGIILAWPSFDWWPTKVIALLAVEGIGILVVFIFFLYWRRKQNEKKLLMQQGLATQYVEMQSRAVRGESSADSRV